MQHGSPVNSICICLIMQTLNTYINSVITVPWKRWRAVSVWGGVRKLSSLLLKRQINRQHLKQKSVINSIRIIFGDNHQNTSQKDWKQVMGFRAGRWQFSNWALLNFSINRCPFQLDKKIFNEIRVEISTEIILMFYLYWIQ